MPIGRVDCLLIRYPCSRNKSPLGAYKLPVRCVPMETRSSGFPLTIVPLVGCFRVIDVIAGHPHIVWLGRGTRHFWLRWRRRFIYTLCTLCAEIVRVIRLRQLPCYWHASGRLAVVRLRNVKFIDLKFKGHHELQGHIIESVIPGRLNYRGFSHAPIRIKRELQDNGPLLVMFPRLNRV